MKRSDIIELVMAGNIVLLGEVRAAKAETREYRVKAGAMAGSMASLPFVKVTVEAADARNIVVTELLPKGTETEGMEVPFRKGQTVCAVIRRLGVNKFDGGIEADGKCHLLEE